MRFCKKKKNDKKTKWGPKMIKNAPFGAGISRICRADVDLSIREIPVSNGAVLMVFRPHFVIFF